MQVFGLVRAEQKQFIPILSEVHRITQVMRDGKRHPSRPRGHRHDSKQTRQMSGQFPFVDEAQVIHRGQALGLFVAQAGHAQDELARFQA